MRNRRRIPAVLGILSTFTTLVFAISALAQEWTLDEEQRVEQPKAYSPFVDQHFPENVYFGDTHHHSSLSVDSGLIGNRNAPTSASGSPVARKCAPVTDSGSS